MKKIGYTVGIIILLIGMYVVQYVIDINTVVSQIKIETAIIGGILFLFLINPYLSSNFKKLVKFKWNRRYFLILLFTGILIYLLVRNDNNAIWVMVLISVLVVTYDMRTMAEFITEYIKKIQIGESLVEFNQKNNALKENINILNEESKLADSIQKIDGFDSSGDEPSDKITQHDNNTKNEMDSTALLYPDEIDNETKTTSLYKKVFATAITSPSAALMFLSSRIESKIRKDIEPFIDTEQSKKPRSIHEMVHLGVNVGIFPPRLEETIRDFWYIRTKIIHGESTQYKSADIMSLIHSGFEIMNILSKSLHTETFTRTYRHILEYLATEGPISKKDIANRIGQSAYANQIKLTYEPWNLIIHTHENHIAINDRGKAFLAGTLPIPESIIRLYTGDWIAVPNTQLITVADVDNDSQLGNG